MAVAFQHQQFTGIYGISGHFDQTFCVTSGELHVCPKCRYVAKVVPHWPDLGGNFCNKACWSHLGEKNAKNPLVFWRSFLGADVKVIPRKKADHIEDNGVPS